jgi:hypothetical protein
VGVGVFLPTLFGATMGSMFFSLWNCFSILLDISSSRISCDGGFSKTFIWFLAALARSDYFFYLELGRWGYLGLSYQLFLMLKSPLEKKLIINS